ncbi:MAG: hypothetical protein L6Q98_10795 [Anaerolineae bacterium]|nr:hypothetical protein [Anaerolineae bacterium]NUQ02686.1 hypothetical protein [Anaerolineae bacterium]
MAQRSKYDIGIRAAQIFLDLRLLVLLFIAFRLLMVVVYTPLFQAGGERGVTAGGDFFTYYQLGALSREGLLPFRDWWSEFPPIPSYLNVTLFQLFGRDYTSFAMTFGFLMLVFDVGNLLMVRRIGSRLYSPDAGMALAWLYALLIAPAVMIWWNFEPMVAFFLLWALAALVDRQEKRAALAAWVGALVKFTPALVLGAVWRCRPTRTSVRYTVRVLGGFALVYALLLAQNAAMTLPSLTAQFSKSSYQTVWALIDGNMTTGNFGPAQERLDPDAAARLVGRPAVIPGIVRTATALAIGAAIFLTTRRRDDRGLVTFTALTLLVFFLQAQGWSPQWMAQIVPLLLLTMPNRSGILALVLLSVTAFVEYPFLFMRTGDTGGVISGALTMPYVILILARTTILVGFCVALYRDLRRPGVDVRAG